MTFLQCLLHDIRLPKLRHYEKLGLPTQLSVPDLASIIHYGSYEALLYLLRDHPELPRIMFRIRRYKPDFATEGLQWINGRPGNDGTNIIDEFDTHGQTPFVLPDGSRIYAYLDCVAPPDHQHGPINKGCIWLEKVSTAPRRRQEHIEIGKVRRIWRMESYGEEDYRLQRGIPLVREKDGRFFWLGINLDKLIYSRSIPDSITRLKLKSWLEGDAWKHIRSILLTKARAQRTTQRLLPDPVLSERALEGYPKEFWSYLCEMENGCIGMTEKSCAIHPDMLDIYQVWERQNKRDMTKPPDPRCVAWPLWNLIPIELRPYFVWNELFDKPTIIVKGANEYQNAMIHKATSWSNRHLLAAFDENGEYRGLDDWEVKWD